MSISIVIPTYNEGKLLNKALDEVFAIEEFTQIIVVNDCSTDNTTDILNKLRLNAALSKRLIIIEHPINKGKGGALQSGFKAATSDYIAIHDADLEYDPIDIKHMYYVALKDDSDLVMGSRFLGGRPQRVSYYPNKVANRLITITMNIFYNKTFTDIYCCHKLFKPKLLTNYEIRSNGFEVDAEMLGKMIKFHNPKVIEVPTSYYGRTYKEGKKIKWFDFFKVINQIIKVRLFA